MKVSLLKAVLQGLDSPQKLKVLIAPEVSRVVNRALERGTSRPIIVEEDTDLEFDHMCLHRLCELFVSSELNSNELAYISDCIQLGESIRCASDDVADFIFEMSDPEINGPFAKERAEQIILELDSKL